MHLVSFRIHILSRHSDVQVLNGTLNLAALSNPVIRPAASLVSQIVSGALDQAIATALADPAQLAALDVHVRDAFRANVAASLAEDGKAGRINFAITPVAADPIGAKQLLLQRLQ